MKPNYKLLTVLIAVLISVACSRDHYEGTAIITQYGFNNCIELKNNEVRVVLEPNIGGRVLVYELNGKNVLYRDSTQDGAVFKTGPGSPAGGEI